MDEIKVGAASDFADGDYRVVAVGRMEVGIFRRGERFIAYENNCPHFGGPVCQGKLYQRVEEVLARDQTSRGLRFAKETHIVCPWHGYEFDLETGCHPADRSVRLKPVELAFRDGAIYLRVRS